MKSYEILELWEEIDILIRKIDLTKEERELVNFSLIKQFHSQLLDVVENKKKYINMNTISINNRMDPANLTAEQYQEFYSNINFNEEVVQKLVGQLVCITSFEFPTLELFPGKGDFTKFAVAAEPLYIADYYMENLEKVGSLFNEFFNNKRLFKVDVKDFILDTIPDNQLGLAFCFNYFMVKDIDFITGWAAEIFKKLRPSGYFVFNFIPEDTPNGLRLSEDHSLAVIKHIELENRLKDIGYEIHKKILDHSYASTITVRRPGEFKQFKLAGSIATVIDI